jgi:hypothetical protein
MSRAAGHEPVGRLWRPDEATRCGFHCDIGPGQFIEVITCSGSSRLHPVFKPRAGELVTCDEDRAGRVGLH